MPKWVIFNAQVLLNEYGHPPPPPPFLFQNWSSHMINIQWAKFERNLLSVLFQGNFLLHRHFNEPLYNKVFSITNDSPHLSDIWKTTPIQQNLVIAKMFCLVPWPLLNWGITVYMESSLLFLPRFFLARFRSSSKNLEPRTWNRLGSYHLPFLTCLLVE